jgi:8-oxo-dGTP pyrophosphatase MutT (NUDIX family)
VSDKAKATIAPWQVLESTYNYRDRWLALRSDTVRLPNGRVLDPYHVIEQPDWVTAVALTRNGGIVLVEEYRHGARQAVIELPSGIHDKPEEPLAAMQRELKEETGFASDEWCPLGSFFANAPRLNNRVHCFLALDAQKVAEPTLDDSEIILTHEVPFAAFLAELSDGRRTFHGFQVGAMWLLHTHARRSGDPRLAALLS